jgi:hypothetical protein
MKTMNPELKKIVKGVKDAQSQLQTLLKDRSWMQEARRYAEKQGKEMKKLLAADADKVRTFVERERKELERIQKQIPGEVEKFRKFVMSQRKELEKLMGRVGKMSGAKGGKAKKRKRPATRKASGGGRKKSAAASSTT